MLKSGNTVVTEALLVEGPLRTEADRGVERVERDGVASSDKFSSAI